MSLKVAEWFGADVSSTDPVAEERRRLQLCPFLNAICEKRFNDGTISGVCSVTSAQRDIPICPNRLYERDYWMLQDAAKFAFGPSSTLIPHTAVHQLEHDGTKVVALGKKRGGELRLPSRTKYGGFFVDWILARIAPGPELAEFVALEVQTIDTTGNYRDQVAALRNGSRSSLTSPAGLNWENVNKRILPQLIYKGNVLRGERLCTKGLFFVCPTPVFLRIRDRLGLQLREYQNLQTGSITFLHYDLEQGQTGERTIVRAGSFSTTVDQVSLAFTSLTAMPPAGVYEESINKTLGLASGLIDI